MAQTYTVKTNIVSEPKFVKESSGNIQNGHTKFGISTSKNTVEDFNALRRSLFDQKKLYEDPEFPADYSSLFHSGRPDQIIKWKRPHEIVNDPKFCVDDFSRFDVRQGELGNCWFIAAISNLTMHQKLLARVIPNDQDFGESYTGTFRFRFWQYGEWKEVIIDDRLPTRDNELIYVRSTDKNEFWSALLEKAYAKVYGCYEALQGGTFCEGLEDFTGGISELYKVSESPPNLFDILSKAYAQKACLGCSIEPDPNTIEAKTPEGLIKGHSYSITGIKYVEISMLKRQGKIPLLRLRNPWGNEVEWNGAWSDKSTEWALTPTIEKNKLGLTFEKDGEFWMSFQDFMKYFTNVEICHLNPDSMSDHDLQNIKKKWEMNTFEGEWVRGVSAGGCRNYLDSFWYNPQYRITLEHPDESDNHCTIIVALMQKHKRSQKSKSSNWLNIGFTLYHLKSLNKCPRPLDKEFFKFTASVARSPSFLDLREITRRFKLPPGVYCIIPSTFDPNLEGEFLLRVFSEDKNHLEENDEGIGIAKIDQKIVSEPVEQQTDDAERIKNYLDKLALQGIEIDGIKLRDILNYAIPKDIRNDKFNEDHCRDIIEMVDTDHSGKLNFREFKELWKHIKRWMTVFVAHDHDCSRTLCGSEMRSVFLEAGYHINTRVLNLFVRRYGDCDGKISFQKYLACVVRLKTMIDDYRRQNPTKSNPVAMKDWIEKTLLCSFND